MLLSYVKMLAEIQAGGSVRDCVITIPSWFTYDQRLMVKDAAEGIRSTANSTRKKLNARIHNMMPTYYRIQAHILKVPLEIYINEQRRTISYGHIH